jgi:hypothetical protein
MTFSVFVNRVGMEPIVEVVERRLESAPVVRMPAAGEAERA